MKSMIIAAAFTIAAAMTANVSAAPVQDTDFTPNKEILIYMPDETPAGVKELAFHNGDLLFLHGPDGPDHRHPHVHEERKRYYG